MQVYRSILSISGLSKHEAYTRVERIGVYPDTSDFEDRSKAEES